MRTTRVTVILMAMALVVAACGGAASTTVDSVAEETPAGDGEGDGVGIVLVGENIAFDTDRLTAPAGQQVTITFENRDSGVPHNLAINGPTGRIATDIAPGPTTQTLTFRVDEPGTYQFVCEVHPVQMVGEIVVEG